MHRKLSHIFHRLSSFVLNHPASIIIPLVFMVNLLLVSPELMPDYLTVNPDDEAKYVDSGWRLLQGDIRDLAWGPIVALVYAPVHLIVGSNLDWFMLELWIGRFIMYAFLWWSIFYLGYQLKEHVSQYILVAVLFVSTPFLKILVNQSDAIFVSFSCLAVANLLRYLKNRRAAYLGLASLFIGFAILARLETIILLVTLLLLSIIFGKGKSPLYKIFLWGVLPMMVVIGLYFAASVIVTGKIDLGVAYKSYDSFEMNQAILTGGDIELARQESRRLFGTQEENRGSILRAILHNPPAFALRILANAKTIPANYLVYFGKKLGPILLLSSVLGGFSLIRKKAWMLISVLFIWPLHALVALGFLSLHIVPQTIYLPLILGALGITDLFSGTPYRYDKLVFICSTFLIFILSWITNKPGFLVSFLLLGCVLLIYWLTGHRDNNLTSGLHFSLFLLLAIGIILREPYQFPNFPALGMSASEKAIHYMETELPAQSPILVPSPLPALAARKSYLMISNLPESIDSFSDFAGYLDQNSISAIYLNSKQHISSQNYPTLENDVEQSFSLGFISQDQSVKVFLVR